MKNIPYLPLCMAMAVTGCSSANDDQTRKANNANAAGTSTAAASQPSSADKANKANKRTGTITVGDETWTFVPSTQCSVYPGNVVHIDGTAKEDGSVEIVLDVMADYRGMQVGEDGAGTSWYAVPDSLAVTIDDQHVKGTASFSMNSYSTEVAAKGSFDIECGY